MQSNGRRMFSNLLCTSLIVETNFESIFIALLPKKKRWISDREKSLQGNLVIHFLSLNLLFYYLKLIFIPDLLLQLKYLSRLSFF